MKKFEITEVQVQVIAEILGEVQTRLALPGIDILRAVQKNEIKQEEPVAE